MCSAASSGRKASTSRPYATSAPAPAMAMSWRSLETCAASCLRRKDFGELSLHGERSPGVILFRDPGASMGESVQAFHLSMPRVWSAAYGAAGGVQHALDHLIEAAGRLFISITFCGTG